LLDAGAAAGDFEDDMRSSHAASCGGFLNLRAVAPEERELREMERRMRAEAEFADVYSRLTNKLFK
jgi:hypothetical protein